MRMRPLLYLSVLLWVAGPARAAPEPLRVDLECQDYGRTKACPEFLLGFIEHNPVFLSSPRARAQVVVYVSEQEVANDDRVHLRFVGDLPGVSPVVEVEVDLDTRVDDDAQRALLEPVFHRGISPFVLAVNPDAVTVSIAPPEDGAMDDPQTTPWGFSTSMSASGSWTESYQTLSSYGSASVSRVEADSACSGSVGTWLWANRSPPVVVDGVEVSIDSTTTSVWADALAEHALRGPWSGAVKASTWHDDPHGLTWLGSNARGGIEWDRYASDDPRGNRLAIAYMAGWQVDIYNQPTPDGSTFFSYPIHGLSAIGEVRKDTVTWGLYLDVSGEVLHPERRHTLSASPSVTVQAGSHVDLDLSVSATQRALVAPLVDASDYESVSRASYIDPLSIYASTSLTFHWDRTNGARNDRFSGM